MVLLQAITSLEGDHTVGQSNFQEHLVKPQSHPDENLAHRFKYPGLEHNLLFEPTCEHVGDYDSQCRHCDKERLVGRQPRPETLQDNMVFHQGRIATGNSLMMVGTERDSVSARCGGVLCFEMEAAGVDINSNCLVIRGISDYADSHKGDRWRYYAAAKAVVFARELLGKIPVRDVEQKMNSSQSACFSATTTGDNMEPEQLMGSHRRQPPQLPWRETQHFEFR